MHQRKLSYFILTVVLSLSLGAQDPSKPLLIRDITVIDGTGRPPLPGMSVVISNGVITGLGRAENVAAPLNALVIEGRGKYLIPGLWNMHVHLGNYEDGKKALSEYLSQGVTGIRDMASPLDDILRLRQEANDGAFLGPRMVVAGPLLQGPLPIQSPLFISVADPVQARQTVRNLRDHGVDFIKVQDAMPHDIYLAVAQEAMRDHLPFVGHIPPFVLAKEASNLGQRSIEHMGGRFWGVLLGASTVEPELQSEEARMYSDILTALERKQPPPTTNMRSDFIQRLLESYDAKKATDLIATFRKNNTWQCPTLVTLRRLWTGGDTQYTDSDRRWADHLIAKTADFVGLMQRAGVGLLAGTDLPPNAPNGTIHDELSYLVEAGLTPAQALATATSNPARFFGQEDRLGTVETGKSADLVLLDADPLEDIHNTRRIAVVIVRGHIVETVLR